jgi:CRP-like cAMP-binding protein/thioredoxin reductase/Fe-S-cluster-containing hydrogenase component 2
MSTQSENTVTCFDIAIIGSGPAGISAASHAAELKVSHVLLEAQASHFADTIFKYQRGKHVMAEPTILPLRSPLDFAEGTREKILGVWETQLKALGVNLQFSSQVSSIKGEKGNFTIALASGKLVQAKHIVLAIGLQGNLRTLGVPGEDLPNVQYQLDDPEEFSDETIIVVGAGDAAIENALALAKQNRVILINRSDEFSRIKDGNAALILAADKADKVAVRYSTSVAHVEAAEISPSNQFPLLFVANTLVGQETIPCHRIIARLGAIAPRKLVESFGIKFPNANMDAIPALSERYESNVPGLYIIGALGGYPLIKQAMNQGYEAIEYILGNNVEPADEPVLRAKFKGIKINSVAEAVQTIQSSVPLLSSLTQLQLRELLMESQIHLHDANAVVFNRNDYTNSFYSIISGKVSVEIIDAKGQAAKFELGKGEFFGEMGLLSGRRRTATIRTSEQTQLLETPRRSMLKLLASVESVRKMLDTVMMKRVVRQTLSQDLTDKQVDYLVESGSLKRFATNQALFTEGDKADGLYLIRRGSVTVSRAIAGKEIVLSYVAAGNYVGEMAMLSDAPRSATVRAAVPTEAILLEAARLTEIMASNTGIAKKLGAQSMQRIKSNQEMETKSESGNIISFLMQQGLGEATDVLLIDESLCIRCNNCEKACAETHDGTSRLNREAGPTFAQIHVPTSCRHCEHPHCMKDCPPDAIRRSANGEVYIADTCIGCGNCERNCPYGVIQMAASEPKAKRPSLISWLMFGLGQEPGVATVNKDKSLPKKAVKCDMCKDQNGGAACVRSCPTGAAIRVAPEKFLAYTSGTE